jgi:hypothetical protein
MPRRWHFLTKTLHISRNSCQPQTFLKTMRPNNARIVLGTRPCIDAINFKPWGIVVIGCACVGLRSLDPGSFVSL